MKLRLLALLIAGAALPATARAQQLTSPSALLTPAGPGVRSTLPVVHLGYNFPAGGSVAPVSGFVPMAFGPAAAADQGFQTAMAIRASSFPPRRYGSLVSMGALTAAYPPFPPAGTVTASNTLSGTSLVPLQSTSYFSNPSSYYGGYGAQPLNQGNYPTTPMASGYSQTIVYPWSAYSGPLRRTFQGY